LVVNRESQL